MAVINGLYIHCTSEDVNRDVEVLEHAVEEGFPISDHVKNGPISISLSGKIVNANNMLASDILSRISSWQRSGTIVNFSGRNVLNNAIITSFSTSHPNDTSGGCDFSLEIKQVRVAKSPFVVTTNKNLNIKVGTLQQVSKYSKAENIYHTVKKGDTIHSLVNNKYRGYGFSVDWIIKNNPSAFSRKLANGQGDPRTLQIGKRLNMGVRR